jgi:hypothetical protein
MMMPIKRPDCISRSEGGAGPTVAKLGPEPVAPEQYHRFLDKAALAAAQEHERRHGPDSHPLLKYQEKPPAQTRA